MKKIRHYPTRKGRGQLGLKLAFAITQSGTATRSSDHIPWLGGGTVDQVDLEKPSRQIELCEELVHKIEQPCRR